MDRLTIRTEIRRLISEKNPGGSYSDNPDLNAFIDEGIREACIKGHVYERSDTLPVVNGNATYDLASDFLEMEAVRNHLKIPLHPIKPSDLGAVFIVSGRPTWYYLFAKGGAVDFQIILVDTPTTVGGGVGTYSYDYYALDEALSDDTGVGGTPNFPVKYHQALVLYGAYRHFVKSKNISLAMGLATEFATFLGLPSTVLGTPNVPTS